MISVSEIMTTQVTTLKTSDSVATAGEIMRKENIRHIPIVNEHGSPVGIITQRDILKAQDSILINDDVPVVDEKVLAVRQIMSSSIAYVHPDDSLRSAGLKIQKHKYGCLPVVENGRVVGIITDSDFVGVAIDLIEQMEYSEDF